MADPVKEKTMVNRKKAVEVRTACGAMPPETIWVEYKRTASPSLRNALMERYLPLVTYVAARIHARMPFDVDVEDLRQAGMFGLMNAIESFDLSRNIKFETFCAPRIRGAILDEMRAMDWVPRLVRARTSKVEHARRVLEMKLGRAPRKQEIAAAMGIGIAEFEAIVKDTNPATVHSMNRKWSQPDGDKDPREVDFLSDNRLPDPQTQAWRSDLKAYVTRGLTRAERLVVILYYYEQMSMKEIGDILELSESRISQMHSCIMARLKARMHRRNHEFYTE